MELQHFIMKVQIQIHRIVLLKSMEIMYTFITLMKTIALKFSPFITTLEQVNFIELIKINFG